MKKYNHRYVTAILFISFIFIFGIATLAIHPVKIFGGLARGYMDSEDSNILKRVGNGFTVMENRESEYFVLHDQCINSYGALQNVIGSQLVNDIDKGTIVLKLNNGYLTFMKTEYTDESKIGDYLIHLKNKYPDTDFMYINKLSKDTTDISLLPENYPYEFTSNINEVMQRLEKNGVSVLDFNKIIDDKNIDKYSLFFKTDHHWTPKTGLWVGKTISDRLNSDFNYDIDTSIFNINKYTIETVKNSFLGSQGKRVGRYYAGVDDFDIITPKYYTDLQVVAKDVGYDVSGTFEQTLIHRGNLTPDNLLNKDKTAYDVYMQGNHDLVSIYNNYNKNGKKALLVLDSYGVVVAPYLSQAFSKLDCIDIRSYNDSVDDYIKNTSPDVVIYMITDVQSN